MNRVLKTSVHHSGEVSTSTVVGEPDEAALVGEAEVDVLEAEDERVDDRVGGDEQHRHDRRATSIQPSLRSARASLGRAASSPSRETLRLHQSSPSRVQRRLDVARAAPRPWCDRRGSMSSSGWIVALDRRARGPDRRASPGRGAAGVDRLAHQVGEAGIDLRRSPCCRTGPRGPAAGRPRRRSRAGCRAGSGT